MFFFLTLDKRTVQYGQPIMRPIFYHAPTAEALEPVFYETEFLLGPYLLAAPLMDRAPTRTCYLPPGTWYSWWCGKERQGGQTYQTSWEEDTDLPLFIRENAIVPTYPEAPSYIPDRSLEDLEILVVLKDQAEGAAIEYFDGESLLAYEIQFSIRTDFIEGKINLKKEGRIPTGYRPPETLHIRLPHRIRNVELISAHRAHLLTPDPSIGSWTRITINNPAFPFRANFLVAGS